MGNCGKAQRYGNTNRCKEGQVMNTEPLYHYVVTAIIDIEKSIVVVKPVYAHSKYHAIQKVMAQTGYLQTDTKMYNVEQSIIRVK